MDITLVGQYEKPQQTPLQAALDTIAEAKRKRKWDAKEKWLKFTVKDDFSTTDAELAFLKTVQRKLIVDARRQYGTSRRPEVLVQVEGGIPSLYVYCD